MSIKLYKASSFKYTPFENFVVGDLAFLNKNGIEIVNKIQDADIIISQNYKHIKKHFWRGIIGGKKFLIWTLAPRFNTHFTSTIKTFFGLVNCHIKRMNRCINVYNTISEKGRAFVANERQKMLRNIITKVDMIIATQK